MRTIKPDKYLSRFIEFTKKFFEKDFLEAVILYGSRAWNYYLPKSDYDLILIFKFPRYKVKLEFYKKKIEKYFPLVTLQYTFEEFSLYEKLCSSWSLYSIILLGGKVAFHTNRYIDTFKRLKKIDFYDSIKKFDKKILIEKLIDDDKYELRELKRRPCYDAVKWGYSLSRKRIQFWYYLKYKKALWNFNKIVKSLDFLNDEDKQFLLLLRNKVYRRNKDYSAIDKKHLRDIIKIIGGEIITQFQSFS